MEQQGQSDVVGKSVEGPLPVAYDDPNDEGDAFIGDLDQP